MRPFILVAYFERHEYRKMTPMDQGKTGLCPHQIIDRDQIILINAIKGPIRIGNSQVFLAEKEIEHRDLKEIGHGVDLGSHKPIPPQ